MNKEETVSADHRPVRLLLHRPPLTGVNPWLGQSDDRCSSQEDVHQLAEIPYGSAECATWLRETHAHTVWSHTHNLSQWKTQVWTGPSTIQGIKMRWNEDQSKNLHFSA